MGPLLGSCCVVSTAKSNFFFNTSAQTTNRLQTTRTQQKINYISANLQEVIPNCCQRVIPFPILLVALNCEVEWSTGSSPCFAVGLQNKSGCVKQDMPFFAADFLRVKVCWHIIRRICWNLRRPCGSDEWPCVVARTHVLPTLPLKASSPSVSSHRFPAQ